MSIQPPNFALMPLRNNADRRQDLEPVSAVGSVTSTEGARFHFWPREGNSEQTNHYEARETRPHQDADSEYAAAPSQILHLNDQRTGGEANVRARRSWKPNRQVVVRNWRTEIASVLLSSGLLAAIVFILVQHNHERHSGWNGINLTTLVAIMSTILRGLMMTAVEEAIGQMKWDWYKSSRPLWHFSIFDNASRGPWGSVLMLFRLKTISFAHVGCFVTIFSIAIGPFTQQAIQTEECRIAVLGSRPSILAAPTGATSEMGYTDELDYETKGALINGFAGLNQFNKNSLLRGCNSGNCTFPKRNGISHSTVGLCSKCVDTTQYLRESRDQMGILLPNNLILSTGEALSISIGSERDDLSWVPGMDEYVRRVSLVDWTIIISTKKACAGSSTGLTGSTNWGYSTPPPCEPGPHHFSSRWDESNFVSAACTLYPCTKHFSAEVIKGSLSETLVSEVSSSEMVSETRYRAQGSIVVGPLKQEENTFYTANASCDIDGVNQDLKSAPIIRAERGGRVYVKINGREVELPKGCTHSHIGTWFLGLNAFLRATMNGFCSEAVSRVADVRCGLRSEQKRPQNSSVDNSMVQDGKNAWWLASIYNHGNSTFNLTSKHVQILADTFTDRMRQIVANQAVYGTEERTAICTRFRWQWLLLPASLLLITALVLMKIIIGEKIDEEDQPIWKNSILPTIYAGSKLKPEMKMIMSNQVESMEEAARGVKARLVLCPDNGRWELLIDDERFGQSYSSAPNIRYQ